MLRFLLLSLLVSLCSCKSEKAKPVTIEEVAALEVKPLLSETVTQLPIITKEGWIEITDDKFTKLDLRYATENNFVDEQMYECGRCFIRKEANASLSQIREELKQKNIGIVLYDCYRPRPVQQKLWDKVPNASYVTPPSRGSMHNRGVALDIGLIDMDGNILDMGTEFDFFGREGHHDYYQHTEEVLNNRKLLKTTMEKHKFASIRTEWWHYSYIVGEYEIAEWLWDCQ